MRRLTSDVPEAVGEALVTAGPAVSPYALRRWVRQRRVATAGRRISAGTMYVAVLALGVLGSVVWPALRSALWPVSPAATADRGAVVGVICLCGLALYGVLRRLGPVVVSRADAAWLLPTPVSRRGLLLPSFLGLATGALVVGGIAGLAAAGQLAGRPVSWPSLFAALMAGAALALLLMLTAAAAQRHDRLARCSDALLLPVAGTVIGIMATDRATGGEWIRAFAPGRLGDGSARLPGALWATLVAGSVVLCVLVARGLAGMPDYRVIESSQLAGAYLDAGYVAEPSFLAELTRRRYWSSRRLSSRPLRAVPEATPTSAVARVSAVPLLAVADLRVALRRRTRLCWLAAALPVPALAAGGSAWPLPVTLLLGGLMAAGTGTDGVRTDAENPVLAHWLAISERRALAARMWVPTGLAVAWCGGALLTAMVVGVLPPGPWWALGLAVGPVAAVAAVRRARQGMVQHDLPSLDTPMGSIATGPLLWLLAGLDALVLALPAVVALAGRPGQVGLSWWVVLVQCALGAAGVAWDVWRAGRRTETTGAGPS